MLVFMGKKCALYTGKYGNQTVNQSAARSVSKLPVGQSVSQSPIWSDSQLLAGTRSQSSCQLVTWLLSVQTSQSVCQLGIPIEKPVSG